MTEIEFFNGREILQDILAMILTIVAIQVVILINDFIKKKGLLSTTVTRKVIHILAAPIYMVFWILYSNNWYSPYIAIIVPALFAIQFILIGTGIMKNEEFVSTMSRSGDPRELLRGTLYYAIIMIIAAIFFWVSRPFSNDFSPVGIVALMSLAFGDGLADVIGRSMNTMKFKIFSEKSIPGTVTMFVSSVIFSIIGLLIFGYGSDLFTITIIACLVATIIEAASPKETDNITIPISIIIVFIILQPILLKNADWSLYKLYTP